MESIKNTLCHVPPGNPANEHTISVGASAVRAHLAHGDILGACPEVQTKPNGSNKVKKTPPGQAKKSTKSKGKKK